MANYLKKLKIELVEGDYENPIQGQVRGPEQVYQVFRDIKDKAQETLIGVYLTDRLEAFTYDILSIGGESVTLVLPEEIFGRSYLTRSRIFILVHNHTSGDPQPTEADREIMKVLKEQSKTLNRTFLDFIIAGDLESPEKGYWSMFEEEAGGRYSIK